MNKDRLWLLLIILIAFTLRLTLLGEQSLWYDEGVTWFLVQTSQLSELIQWTAADIQPPLYYLLIRGTSIIFGPSEWALRFPSVIFNTLTLPLLYVLARRLLTLSGSPRSPAPLLAAILFAFSPLMVYYSQEARMYTLLVFEATLTSYLLLKIVRSNPTSPTPYSLLYALTATIALYTHYFAIFLLIAHALYTALILWQRGWPKALIAQWLPMFGLTALLFAPWLPILLSRLGDDPSYWPGALKLNEALRKVLISFTVGETVFEQTGLWLALIYFGFWILDFGFSIQNSKFKIQNLLFLLLWLLLPLIFILILSYRSPKFNPRYTMLAWPAFVLIIATTLASLLTTHHASRTTPHSLRPAFYPSRFTFHVSRFLFTLTLLFILSTSVFSLYHWFTDPRFSKDDFKALAQFVRERIADDETVLLSPGHLFPVWAYYYGWQNWTPLPRLERLDVNRVTGLNIATNIATAVKGQGGVWLVTWQDEVIDPNGVVPFWLDRIGQRPGDAGDFWGVGLEHWRLVPDKAELLYQDPIQRPATSNSATGSGYNFANQVDLLGMTQLSDTEVALFWRPRQPLPDNLLLTLSLTDADGFEWAQEKIVQRPGAYLYPPSRWPVGQVVMTRQQLSWQFGTPPGPYIAEIGLGQVEQPAGFSSAAGTATTFVGWDILDEQGRPQRRTALLEFIHLSHLVQLKNGSLSMAEGLLVDLLPIIGVRDSILSQKTAEPGDRILLTLLWQAGQFNLDDVSVAFDVVDARYQTFRIGSSPTPSRNFNLPSWQPGDIVLGQYWLDIPAKAAPGSATLNLHIINTTGHVYDELFPIDQLEVLPTERNFTLPTVLDVPLEAGFSGQTTLLGLDCSTWTGTTCPAVPGQPVTLTFYWRAEAHLDKNYTIFTHLLGPNETVVVNADHTPSKPTQGWVPAEIITDPVTLTVPANVPPGDYAVEVGLYDAADPAFPRLPLTTGETRMILPQPVVIE